MKGKKGLKSYIASVLHLFGDVHILKYFLYADESQM